MREPRGPLQTVPRLLDDGIDAVADLEQALEDIENHERIANAHLAKARRLRKAMATRVVAAAEVMTALRRRAQDARAARRAVVAAPGVEYPGPERRSADRRARLADAA